MARDEEVLFGKIGVKKGFISKKQLKKALAFQEKKKKDLPIGEIMLKADLIDKKQLKQIVKQQQKVLNKEDKLTQQKKEDSLFGKIVLKKGYLSKKQLNKALKKQAKLQDRGRVIKLGELLLQVGLLDSDQVHEILEEQKKQVMQCVSCGSKFNVAVPPRTDGEELECPSCGDRLEQVDKSEKPRAEDEVAMPEESESESVSSSPDQQPSEDEPDLDPGGTMLMDEEQMKQEAEMKEAEEAVSLECVICNKNFEKVPDQSGRVECPNCTTIFSASEGMSDS